MAEDSENAPKRRGRPPMARPERKLANITFRSRGEMRERLQASAEARGLSISEEVERRVDLSLDMALDPFKTVALRMIVERWRLIDAMVERTGSLDDSTIYARHAHKAVMDALDIADDPSMMKHFSNQRLEQFYSGQDGGQRISEALAKNDNDLDEASEDIADSMQEGAIFASVWDGNDSPKKTKAEREQEARDAAARKANPELVALTPEEMTEMMGPPGRGRAKVKP